MNIMDEKQYKQHKQKTAERFRVMSAADREISGDLPKCKHPRRRSRAERGFLEFCRVYGQRTFRRPFNPMQLAIISEIERVVTEGGKKAVAAYRRGGKSSLLRWAILYAMAAKGHRFTIYIGATEKATKRTRDYIYNELITNPKLLEDYPEICYPFIRTNGVRQTRLLYKGNQINMVYSDETITFPTIEGSKLSGHRVDFRSMNSNAIRGSDHTIRGAGTVRPSVCFLDDIESDESAWSPKQNDDMYNNVMSTLEYLAGYDKDGFIQPLAVLCVGTVIAPGDFMTRILDPDASPDYCGEIYRRVVSMPQDMDLWRRYKEIRTKSLRRHRNISEATEFYRSNQAAMDEGCVVVDPDDRESGMISGIQYAMDCWARSERAFFTEMQNDPDSAKYLSGGFLSPPVVLSKVVELPRCGIPPEAVFMTAHIDVGKHLLWYCVTAWNQKLDGHVVDYGVYPPQQAAYIRKETPNMSLQDFYEDGDEYDKLKAALLDLFDRIFEQQYFCNGKELDVNRLSSLIHFVTKKPLSFLGLCGVDASDGNYEKTIWQAVRESKHRNRIVPAYGAAAKARLIRHLRLGDGESRRIGCDWIANPEKRKNALTDCGDIVALKYDANLSRSRINSGLLAPLGTDGTITIFHGTRERHAMLSEQLCAEDYVRSMVGSNEYDRWTPKRPRVADNDLWDCLTATDALRSFAGLDPESTMVPAKQKKRLVLSELQAESRRRR